MLTVKFAKSKMENEEGLNHLHVKVSPELSKEKIEKPIAIIAITDKSGSMNDIVQRLEHVLPQMPAQPLQPQMPIQPHPFSVGNQGIVMGGYVQPPIHSPRETHSTKMDFVKSACVRLVDTLKEGDYFGVVSFNNMASVEYPLSMMSREEKMKIKDRIQTIQAMGGTNVSDGLEQAFRLIPESLKETHHVKLILLSDGEANVGITDSDALASIVHKYREAGVSVSTIGVGIHYNSFFMETIATASGGMFYHLEKMEQLDSIFVSELETLSSLTTKNARVKISQPEGIHFSQNLNGFSEEKPGVIYLGNLYSEQELVLEIFTNEKTTGTKEFSVKMEYEDAEGNKKAVEMKRSLPLVDESEMDGVEIDHDVVQLAKKLMEAKAKKEAIRHYEVGDMTNLRSSMSSTFSALDSMATAYNMSNDDVTGELSSLQSSMMTNQLDREASKLMYAKSFNATRNKK